MRPRARPPVGNFSPEWAPPTPARFELHKVGDWQLDEEHPVFPVGSQPKQLLLCPENEMRAPLYAGHKYLLKKPEGWQQQQIWAEFIAYHIGLLCNVPVPPCYNGVDSDGSIGALVEFFHGYPRAPHVDRFVHGSDILQRFIVDKKRGRPHGVRSNVTICKAFGIKNPEEYWGRLLVFDALIGNTDRHPDNWGIIWRYRDGILPSIALAPAFDNATSLGHEIPQEGIEKMLVPARLARYINQGRHHCGWSAADDRRGKHFELCARFMEAYPAASETMRDVIRFDRRSLAWTLDACSSMGGSLPLTAERERLIYELVCARQERLGQVLGA